MLRIIAIGLGGIFIALGLAWFFTSPFDSVAMSVTGTPATPMSKMTFGDSLSLIVAGLGATGILLLAFGVFGAVSTGAKSHDANSKPV